MSTAAGYKKVVSWLPEAMYEVTGTGKNPNMPKGSKHEVPKSMADLLVKAGKAEMGRKLPDPRPENN